MKKKLKRILKLVNKQSRQDSREYHYRSFMGIIQKIQKDEGYEIRFSYLVDAMCRN